MQEETVVQDDTQVDPTQVDTQQVVDQSPNEPEVGHDDAQIVGESAASDSQPDNSDAASIAKKREEGKLKQTQKELDALRKQVDQQINWIAADPDRFKSAIMEMRGITEDEAEREIQNLKAQNPQLWADKVAKQKSSKQSVQQTVQQAYEDPYIAAQRAIIDMQDTDKFKQLVPDMDPDANPDKIDEISKLATHVGRLGNELMAAKPGLKRVDAWVQAYKVISGKTDTDVETAREEGYLSGLVGKNTDRASTVVNPVAGKSQSKGSFRWSDAELKVIKESGMTEEEYYKYKTM